MSLIDSDKLRDEIMHDAEYDNDTINHFLDLVDCQPAVDADAARCKVLKEVSEYCFEATLEYLDKYKAEKGDTFVIPFQVIAENIYKAERLLEEWLSVPERTGYKFKRCVGIVRKPSNFVILEEKLK